MGVSTDGQLSFGISFPEEHGFPWRQDGYDDGEHDWWAETICGYKPPFEIFTEAGEYIDGVRPEQSRIDEYYAHRKAFDAEHPLPVEVVLHCSYDYPMFIIAAKESFHSNSRGYPTKIEPEALVVSDEARQAVIDFCNKYCDPPADMDMEPRWYLTSLWG